MNANTPMTGLLPTHAAGVSHAHESAVAQVAGAVHYIDDLPEVRGTLHAAPVLSTVACGQVRALDLSACLQAPGVRGVVTAADIVGDPVLAAYTHDEPIFASERVSHVGQVMALVLADTHQQALHATRLARMDVVAEPPVLDARTALQHVAILSGLKHSMDHLIVLLTHNHQ